MRAIIKQAEQWPFRVAEWDEAAARARLEGDLARARDRASKLKYVTPRSGVTMAVGPTWSGSVPDAHPRYIPGLTAKDDIHGYLRHDPDGYVQFVYTDPMMRRMNVGTSLLEHAGISDTAYSYNYTPDGKKFFRTRTGASTKLYRGVNVDTSAPGLERVREILHPPGQADPLAHHPGWDHPEVGGHLLDWLAGQHSHGPASGIGGHWSTDPVQAESFARWPREDTGHGGDLQAVIEADWPGGGEDAAHGGTREFDEQGNRIRSFPWEHEVTLSSGTPLNVTGLKIRPYDDAYWNSPADLGSPAPDENHEGPWHHHVLPQPSARRA